MSSGTERDGRPVAVLASNRAYGIASSRLPLVRHLAAAGWRVVVAGAEDSSVPRLEEAGAEFAPVPFRRGGLDPRRDSAAVWALWRLYRRLGPRLVHHFNVKPIVFGGLAALPRGGVTVVCTVTGLGYGLNGSAAVAAPLRLALRTALRQATATTFQNRDDLGYFVERKMVDPTRSHLIASSGVELDRFSPGPEIIAEREPTVLLVGRMVWQKGVAEFVEAARRLRVEYPRVRFVLGGEFDDDHPDAVPRRWVEARVAEGVVEFAGYVNDMPETLRSADLFVLPSTFGEGFPRVLLEAAATAVPVVTSDLPGCRDAVVDGRTGLLVPPRDPAALAAALDRLLRDPVLRRRMGREARAHVAANFDRRSVVRRTLDLYRRAGLPLPPGAAA